MRRPMIVIVLVGVGTLLAFWLLLQTPGSLNEALSHPIQAMLGTQQHLNATLLEVSENGDPVLVAGRRLLQPFGGVHLVKIYEAPDSDSSKKH